MKTLTLRSNPMDNMRLNLIVYLLFFFLLALSCAASKKIFGDDEVATTSESAEFVDEKPEENNVYSLSNRELELKISQLWGRVDELNKLVMRLKERGELVEKGLMLGIIPNELQNQAVASEQANQNHKSVVEPKVESHEETASKTEEQLFSEMDYKKMLAQAQTSFDGGKFGKAIVEFSELGKNFPKDKLKGNHLFWIGLSWYYLKEYHLSDKFLVQFSSEYPMNHWTPKADFFIAKGRIRSGLRKQGLDQLKKVIEKYPKNEVAAMAALEIEKLQSKL